ncbi:MAG: DUF2779 domain-containing protein [Coriobacteriia bacterium]|nr:DUF2779 domain-containing protein [Coriobacteriia bacterium]
MARMISKSRFQKGLQCEKALWLGFNRRELATPPDEAQQRIFDQGTEVGQLARQLFPGGVEVAEDFMHPRDALATTARLIAEGARVLYEPAFEHDGAFARVDILVANEDDRWDLYEVKSSGSLKDVHITDAAVQAYAVEGSGLKLRRIAIVRLNTSYVYAGGEYDLQGLFAIDDITEMARGYMPTVPTTLTRFREVLEGPEPEIRVGAQCSTPYPCDFAEYCHAFMPGEFPVTALPRLSEPRLHALLDEGITSIRDVPEDFPGLTSAQRESIAVVRAGEPYVDVEGLSAALAGLEFPVCHLDFETVNPALPVWPGTRPYEVIPFQYSVHIQHSNGNVEHREYIDVGTVDPRRALAEHLLDDLGETGSVVHYTNFERTRLTALAEVLPDLAPAIKRAQKRLFDLEAVIRKNTCHPLSIGRSSIKSVLPAWCADLSYAGMSIADGQTASARYLEAVKGTVSQEEAEAIFADLLEYCGLDTLAMVRLLDEMMLKVAG